MYIYLSLYITSFVLSILSILAKNIILHLTSIYTLFFMILVFVGLRHGLGSDWDSYNALYHFSWEEKNIAIPEVGFNAISHLFYITGIRYNYFVFFITLMALLPILKLSRYYKYSIIVLFIYYTVYLTSLMGLMRQMIAVSLCLFAAEKLYQKKNRQYFFYVVAAILFHTSAIVFFLAYFVQILKINIRVILCLLIALLIFNYIFIEHLGFYLIQSDMMTHKVIAYFYLADYNRFPPYYSSNSISTILMFAQKFVFIIIFLHYFTKLSYNHKAIFYLKIYSLSLVMNLMFYFSIPIIATRGSIYFSIVEIVLLALICEVTKNKWLYIFVILLYGGLKYFKILFSLYSQMVPYQSIFSL